MGKKKSTKAASKKKAAKKKAPKKRAPKKPKSSIFTTQKDVAEAMDVSVKTVQSWALRPIKMPGRPGRYDVNKIKQWYRDTVKGEDPDNQMECYPNCDTRVMKVNRPEKAKGDFNDE